MFIGDLVPTCIRLAANQRASWQSWVTTIQIVGSKPKRALPENSCKHQIICVAFTKNLRKMLLPHIKNNKDYSGCIDDWQ